MTRGLQLAACRVLAFLALLVAGCAGVIGETAVLLLLMFVAAGLHRLGEWRGGSA